MQALIQALKTAGNNLVNRKPVVIAPETPQERYASYADSRCFNQLSSEPT